MCARNSLRGYATPASRRLESSAYSGESSIPRNLRPSLEQTAAVVLEPLNGSITRSPGFELQPTMRRSSSMGSCAEDMHMPMHVGDNSDKGGNQTQVRFYKKGSNMHRLWDSDMIERTSKDEQFWLTDLAALDTPEARDAAMKGTVEDWATESILAARQAYQVPETGMRLKSGQKLGDAYLQANIPTVRRRLYQGSVRLALVLNEAFPEQP